VADEWREEGREEGIEQRNIEIVQTMLHQDIDLELIAKLTGLDETKVTEIQTQWESEQEDIDGSSDLSIGPSENL